MRAVVSHDPRVFAEVEIDRFDAPFLVFFHHHNLVEIHALLRQTLRDRIRNGELCHLIGFGLGDQQQGRLDPSFHDDEQDHQGYDNKQKRYEDASAAPFPASFSKTHNFFLSLVSPYETNSVLNQDVLCAWKNAFACLLVVGRWRARRRSLPRTSGHRM